MIRVPLKQPTPPHGRHKSLKATLNLDLSFVATTGRDRWVPPFAEVVVKAWGPPLDETDWLSISARCVSRAEFDYQIDRLAAELEKIRKEGHRRFARHQSDLKRKSKSGATEER